MRARPEGLPAPEGPGEEVAMYKGSARQAVTRGAAEQRTETQEFRVFIFSVTSKRSGNSVV